MSGPDSTSAIDTPSTDERPGKIDAKPVRHPGRWVAVAVIALLLAMAVNSLVTNDKWDLAYVPKVMNFKPVLEGMIKGTIVVTIGAMIIGVLGGIFLAMMRLSDNPVLKGVAFVYTWFFRAVPRLVLLVMLGTGAAYLYPRLDLGLPFGKELASFLGLSSELTIASLDINALSQGIWVGIIGLGLSEAAYFAEIARAGILSVDEGQSEAARAIGMSESKTLRRIVLPQAMRVIVPPTGNETIAMVKDTSLLFGVPISMELWFQIDQVANETARIMGAYLAGFLWYLIITTVLMIGQYFLERHFGRGHGAAGAPSSKLSMLGKGV